MALIDCGPQTLDLIRVRAGDDTTISLVLNLDQVAWNLTGATVTAQVRRAPTDQTVMMTPEVTVTDAVAGQVDVTFTGDAVRTLLAGAHSWRGVWDLQVSGIHTQTACAGKILCEQDVTRTEAS